MGNKNNFISVHERLLDAEQLLKVGIERGALSSIERDILLEKLRASYELLLFDRPISNLDTSPPDDSYVSEKGSSQTHAKPEKVDVKIVEPKIEKRSEPVAEIEPPKVEKQVFLNESVNENEVQQEQDEVVFAHESGNETANHNLDWFPEEDVRRDKELIEDEASSSENGITQKSSSTLAEKYQGKKKFRNEVLGAGKKDVASVLKNKPIIDLTKAIGINDKFLFTKELFNGNAELYAKTIKQLNGYSDINDALIYIGENFSWDNNNEAANQLIDLVRRKLLHD